MTVSFDFNQLVTPQEYADLAQVSRRSLYNWLNAGTAPPHEVIAGRVFFYRPAPQEPK